MYTKGRLQFFDMFSNIYVFNVNYIFFPKYKPTPIISVVYVFNFK